MELMKFGKNIFSCYFYLRVITINTRLSCLLLVLLEHKVDLAAIKFQTLEKISLI